MTADKLCIDCKHYRYKPLRWWDFLPPGPPPSSLGAHQCHRPQRTSPVTGEIIASNCWYQRADPHNQNECGRDAKYWELRP